MAYEFICVTKTMLQVATSANIWFILCIMAARRFQENFFTRTKVFDILQANFLQGITLLQL